MRRQGERPGLIHSRLCGRSKTWSFVQQRRPGRWIEIEWTETPGANPVRQFAERCEPLTESRAFILPENARQDGADRNVRSIDASATEAGPVPQAASIATPPSLNLL